MLSVTQILRLAGMMPEGPWYTEEARDRGKATHWACRYAAEDDLDTTDLDPVVLERVQNFQRWRAEMRPEILAWEEEVHGDGYVGHVDLRVRLNGDEGIIDIKPAPADWHPLQLMFYAAAYDRPMLRWNLYLGGPNYKLVQRKDRDIRIARAALVVAQWRIDHGLSDDNPA